jgi:hypothetical protein
MAPTPARLTPNLLAAKKGDAAPGIVDPDAGAPATPAPSARQDTANAPSPAPATPPEPTSRPATAQTALQGPTTLVDAAMAITNLRRAVPAQAKRSSFSTRLPDDMVEWLRVRAFLEKRGLQQIVEEAIEFYIQHHPNPALDHDPP